MEVLKMDAIQNDAAAKLEKAAAYIVKKCADETASGTYFVHSDDIPDDILTPELFTAHINRIAEMMKAHESVAEADVEDGTISVVMYLDYCPNYEPAPEEAAQEVGKKSFPNLGAKKDSI
jgi:hypothetical protein